MRIICICGNGLGSSFLLEMNVRDALKSLGISGIETTHSDLGSCTRDLADVFVVALDIADEARRFGEVVVINNIIDKNELHDKIKELMVKHGKLKPV